MTYGVETPALDGNVEVLGAVDGAVEEVGHAQSSVRVDDGVDGVEPLLGLDGIGVGGVCAHARKCVSSARPRPAQARAPRGGYTTIPERTSRR